MLSNSLHSDEKEKSMVNGVTLEFTTYEIRVIGVVVSCWVICIAIACCCTLHLARKETSFLRTHASFSSVLSSRA